LKRVNNILRSCQRGSHLPRCPDREGGEERGRLGDVVQKQVVRDAQGACKGEHARRETVRTRRKDPGGRDGDAPCTATPARPMHSAENRTEPTLVRKKMTATLMAAAPTSFSRSDTARPAMTRGASPRTTNTYPHAEPRPEVRRHKDQTLPLPAGGGRPGAGAGRTHQRGQAGTWGWPACRRRQR
jgi:hypothetical protein